MPTKQENATVGSITGIKVRFWLVVFVAISEKIESFGKKFTTPNRKYSPITRFSNGNAHNLVARPTGALLPSRCHLSGPEPCGSNG